VIPTLKAQIDQVIADPSTELLKPKVDPNKVVANPRDV